MDSNANLPISTTGAPLPTQLTRWSPWLKPDSASWEASTIRSELLAELDELAAQAKAAWGARATPAEMGEIFKRLSLACRGQPGETTDRKATMALFLRYLAEYPAGVLADAVDAWIKTQVFMPAISELRALCETELMKLTRAWRRAEFLVKQSRAEHERRAQEAAREAEWAAERARNPSGPILGRPVVKIDTRHPRNRDLDGPAEKARIARICTEARLAAKIAGTG